MSRRKKRSTARKNSPAPSPPDDDPAPVADHPRGDKRFLAVAAVLQAAWITFLIAMALT